MTNIFNDSDFIKIYKNINDDIIKFSIDTIVRIIKMIDVSYSGLVLMLENYKNEISEKVFMQNWLIIGNLNRLRCLINQLPGIKKNEPWFQLFLRKIYDVEKSRHFIEHYNQELKDLILEVKPTLGHISWVELENDKKYSIFSSVIGIIRNYKGLEAVNPAGKNFRYKIDHITYFLGDEKINISNLYYDLIDFAKNLELYIKNKYS